MTHHDHDHGLDSRDKAHLAHDASMQLAYILSALGLQDDHGASAALRECLERGLKPAALAVAVTLAGVKVAIRANVEDSKAVSRDRDTAKADKETLAAESDRLQEERDTATGDRDSARRDLAFWFREAEAMRVRLENAHKDTTNAKTLLRIAKEDNAELVEARDFWKAKGNRTALDTAKAERKALTVENPKERKRTPNPFDCGCDLETEFCDVCAMPDPRDPDYATDDTALASLCQEPIRHTKDPDPSDTPVNPGPTLAERRAARQEADDAQRARDRSARRKRERTSHHDRGHRIVDSILRRWETDHDDDHKEA